MATVQIDITEGAVGSHDLVDGWDVVRTAVVWDLNSDGSRDTAGIITDAENAVATITGPRGMSYGTSPSGAWTPPYTTVPTDWVTNQFSVGTFLKEFKTDIIAPTVARVKIIYKGYALARYEFGGSLNMVPTNLDVNGNPLRSTYTYPDPYPANPSLAGKTVTQGCMTTTPVPESTFSIKYVVTAGKIGGVDKTAMEILTYFKTLMEGKINAVAYPVGYIPGEIHCVMCEKVDGTSRDGGITFDMTVLFHYRSRTWDTTCTFIDPTTGQPPPDFTPAAPKQTIPSATFYVWSFGPN